MLCCRAVEVHLANLLELHRSAIHTINEYGTTNTRQPIIVHRLNRKPAACTAELSLCRIHTSSVCPGARTQNLYLQRKLAQVLVSAGYELTMLNCCQFGVVTPAGNRIHLGAPIISLKYFGMTHVAQMRRIENKVFFLINCFENQKLIELVSIYENAKID